MIQVLGLLAAVALMAWSWWLAWWTARRVMRGEAFQPTARCARQDAWLGVQLVVMAVVLQWRLMFWVTVTMTVIVGVEGVLRERDERRAREAARARDRGGW